MTHPMKPIHIQFPLSIPWIISILGLVLVPIIAIKYSYNNLFTVASCTGFILLLAVSLFLWRTNQKKNDTLFDHSIILGIVLGILWVIEIGINNFVAPRLPTRDIIDDIFWAVIGLSILVDAVINSFQTNSIRTGTRVGSLIGFISGIFACSMALSMVVFGMHFIITDPLNIAEWVVQANSSQAPSMAAYFAYETMAGAFLHLIVLGIIMGMLLGVLGGLIGKTIKSIDRWQKFQHGQEMDSNNPL
jgi:hypothetical protein